MTFSIPDGIFDIYREVCDELINNTNIASQCTLYYNPTRAECPNCTFDSFTNIIDVYVNYLRKKVDRDYTKKLIHTVRGIGYVLKED